MFLAAKKDLNMKKKKQEEIQSLFDEIANLPICLANNEKTSLVNTINGITLQMQKTNNSFKMINGSHAWNLEVASVKKLLEAWIILSKPYYVTQWHEDAASASEHT